MTSVPCLPQAVEDELENLCDCDAYRANDPEWHDPGSCPTLRLRALLRLHSATDPDDTSRLRPRRDSAESGTAAPHQSSALAEQYNAELVRRLDAEVALDDLARRIAAALTVAQELGVAHTMDQWDDACVRLRAALKGA